METIYFGVIAVVTASVAATWQQERNFYHFQQQQYPHLRFFFHVCCSMYGLFSNFCRTKSSNLGVGEALFIWNVEVGGINCYFLCRTDVPFFQSCSLDSCQWFILRWPYFELVTACPSNWWHLDNHLKPLRESESFRLVIFLVWG